MYIFEMDLLKAGDIILIAQVGAISKAGRYVLLTPSALQFLLIRAWRNLNEKCKFIF